MSYLLAFLAGLFGLGVLNSLARPRYRDPNREFYDADAQYDADSHCAGGPADEPNETPAERERLLSELLPEDRELVEQMLSQYPSLTAANVIALLNAPG